MQKEYIQSGSQTSRVHVLVLTGLTERRYLRVLNHREATVGGGQKERPTVGGEGTELQVQGLGLGLVLDWLEDP